MPPAKQPVTTATEPQPLSETEREQMNAFLARASAGQGPATRIGDPYVALINLNVPRRGTDPMRGSDLVMAGETVNLTPDEAALYLRHGPADGRRTPVIRPATGPESSSLKPQRIPPKAVSGPLHAPPPRVPGMPPTGMPLPDPEGSSVIMQQMPEDPVPGSENSYEAPQADADLYVSAEDVIPERTRQRQQAARG